MTHNAFLLLPVLIETYWNVKLDSECEQWLVEHGINRNILECKDTNNETSMSYSVY